MIGKLERDLSRRIQSFVTLSKKIRHGQSGNFLDIYIVLKENIFRNISKEYYFVLPV